MSTTYEERYACHPEDFKSYDTGRIRRDFLIDSLFQADNVHWVYSHFDRYMAGSAVPITSSLSLESIDPLKSDYFLERRELGIINIGGSGQVVVDGEVYEVGHKQALYIGKEKSSVSFSSKDPQKPAKFYLNSAPAGQAYPTKLVDSENAEIVHMGDLGSSNVRTIRKLLVNSILKSNQLQMGMTELAEGSVWNTMPAHTHNRRMEIYLYFDLAEGAAVCHFMGQPQETRHIWLQNEQAVISPPWSIHCGSGTHRYSFVWGMAGENLDYGDMDKVLPNELR